MSRFAKICLEAMWNRHAKVEAEVYMCCSGKREYWDNGSSQQVCTGER